MKINDEALWEAQRAEIAARPDAEVGQLFLEFCQAWCEAAESQLETYDRSAGSRRWRRRDPVRVLRDTFEQTQAAKGAIPPGWLGQLLLVICSNWAYGGDDLFNQLNPLEQRFVGDAAYIIQNEANVQARTVPDAPAG